MPPTLRPYQQRGADDLRVVFRSGSKAPVYVAPTGSGKTVLFTHIARGASERGNSVWILVHRQELLYQTSRALYVLGIDHGVVAPGFTPRPDARVQVCSVQTLARRIEQGRVGNVDLVVIDEAHHATAGTWRKVVEGRPDARIIGVTATPARTDGQGLGIAAGGVFDTLVLGPTLAELIADGYLCAPAVYAPPSQLDMSGVRLGNDGDYVRGEMARRMDKPTITGDAVDHYRRLCNGAPAIAFCASVEHAKHVAAQFRGAGYKSECIDGKMLDTERKDRIDALGNGRLNVLASCEIVSEGTDIPVVTAAILLRPTVSLTLYLQQVGRALRPVYPDGADDSTREGRLAAIARSAKPRAVILDHVGNTFTHGLPDDDRTWDLAGVPKARRGENREKPLAVTQCPKCYAAHRPGPECPSCGHVYQPTLIAPKQVDGRLQELSEADAEAIRKAREKKAVLRARSLDELKAIARARGYKESWAEHVWNGRQRAAGRWRPVGSVATRAPRLPLPAGSR
jgi:DNA repair protein RadD